MMRRRLSLLELVFSTVLLTGATLLLGSAIRLGFLWNTTTRETLAVTTRLDRLQTRLHRVLRQGRPIPCLTITRDGRILETPAPDAAASWGQDGALVLRGARGYTVLVAEDGRVEQYEVGRDGRVQTDAVVDDVRLAEFSVLRDEAQEPRGVAYRVAFRSGGPEVEGFVGVRVPGDASSSVPPRPQPAPRYARPGGSR